LLFLTQTFCLRERGWLGEPSTNDLEAERGVPEWGVGVGMQRRGG
jgi:hypothetical protein